ncbi:MAG: GNAT family N-acetyltransferase [Nitrospirota bacterium]
MVIREATEDDVPQLAALYAGSVKALAPSAYSGEQVNAWASFAENFEAFRRFVLEPQTIVMEDDSGILGFCGVDATGHVASLYVRADRARQGIGTRLLQVALDHAGALGVHTFHAEASELSLPVFQRFGFVVRGIEKGACGGAEFERYLVRKGSPTPYKAMEPLLGCAKGGPKRLSERTGKRFSRSLRSRRK